MVVIERLLGMCMQVNGAGDRFLCNVMMGKQEGRRMGLGVLAGTKPSIQ